jgi:hypothetical protein
VIPAEFRPRNVAYDNLPVTVPAWVLLELAVFAEENTDLDDEYPWDQTGAAEAAHRALLEQAPGYISTILGRFDLGGRTS